MNNEVPGPRVRWSRIVIMPYEQSVVVDPAPVCGECQHFAHGPYDCTGDRTGRCLCSYWTIVDKTTG